MFIQKIDKCTQQNVLKTAYSRTKHWHKLLFSPCKCSPKKKLLLNKCLTNKCSLHKMLTLKYSNTKHCSTYKMLTKKNVLKKLDTKKFLILWVHSTLTDQNVNYTMLCYVNLNDCKRRWRRSNSLKGFPFDETLGNFFFLIMVIFDF